MTPGERLKDWVRAQHQGQLIRRTTKPYFNHLLFVAEKAGAVATLGYETGLCHDLLEDTTVTADELLLVLKDLGYSPQQSVEITRAVIELTDIYTKKAYPELSKITRKEKEAERLVTVSALAQTVKYADLIDNINWMLQFDRAKAADYLQKKKTLLSIMNKGNEHLRLEAVALIDQHLNEYL